MGYIQKFGKFIQEKQTKPIKEQLGAKPSDPQLAGMYNQIVTKENEISNIETQLKNKKDELSQLKNSYNTKATELKKKADDAAKAAAAVQQ